MINIKFPRKSSKGNRNLIVLLEILAIKDVLKNKSKTWGRVMR